MTRTAAISVRVEPALKAALEKAAAADRRSLASYVENILVDHIATFQAGCDQPSDD